VQDETANLLNGNNPDIEMGVVALPPKWVDLVDDISYDIDKLKELSTD
jgi:hypothetical protein